MIESEISFKVTGEIPNVVVALLLNFSTVVLISVSVNPVVSS